MLDTPGQASPIHICLKDDSIIIGFSTPIVAFGLDKYSALELANKLVELAHKIGTDA
jgi:hypothetical protein